MKLHSSISALLLAAAVQTASAYDFESGGIYYNFISVSERTVSVTSGDEPYSGVVTIPESVSYNGVSFSVVSIAESAFYGNEVVNVTLPETLTSIGQNAFGGCTKLTSIEFPASLTQIKQYAFSGCISLTELTIPRTVTWIYEYGFLGCSGVKVLTIEDSENGLSMGRDVFHFSNLEQAYFGRDLGLIQDWNFGRNTLKHIEFGPYVTTIHSSICSGSVELETIILGENIKNIDASAFSRCSKIKSIVTPDAIEKINNGAFQNCTSLETVVLGANLSSLGDNAFNGCNAIRTITARMQEPKAFNENVFTSNTYLNSTLYVPEGFKADYTSQPYWSNFLLVEEGAAPEGQKHQLTVDVNGHGEAIVAGRPVRSSNYSLFVAEGSDVRVNFVPDTQCVVSSLTLNGEDVTADVADNSYTLRGMAAEATLRVEFGAATYLLTLRDSRNGQLREVVNYGERYTYLIEPDAECTIHSVTYNSLDVTAELGADGSYTTPAITADATLTVIFEETGAGIESPATAAVRIAPTSQGIRIQGAERGTRIAVHNADGSTVTSRLSQGGNDAVTLAAGQTYVVAVGDRTFKVRL